MATFAAACATLNLVVLAMTAIAATSSRAASLPTIDKEKTDENRKRAHHRLRCCHY